MFLLLLTTYGSICVLGRRGAPSKKGVSRPVMGYERLFEFFLLKLAPEEVLLHTETYRKLTANGMAFSRVLSWGLGSPHPGPYT